MITHCPEPPLVPSHLGKSGPFCGALRVVTVLGRVPRAAAKRGGSRQLKSVPWDAGLYMAGNGMESM
jgi:hypothetical protein